MKTLSVLCVVISIGLSTTATFGRGGMGSHHMSVSGGAFGTTAAAPGTNSLGTALSSSGIGAGPMKGHCSAPIPPSTAKKRRSTR